MTLNIQVYNLLLPNINLLIIKIDFELLYFKFINNKNGFWIIIKVKFEFN